uniref:30S ribosomal protein S13 n=1 Tax=Lygus hesperus TaxID=30085 RepID=A0A0A9YJQ7_LYGHE
MDYEKARREELDVLKSVHGEDLTLGDDAFVLALRPNDSKNDTSITLRVEYGDVYPSGPPRSIELMESTGLAPDCRLHLSLIIDSMVEFIGRSTTIFDIIQSIQDFLHDQKTPYDN